MSERKVINKYYPPDFDPLKVKPSKKSKNKLSNVLQTVRLMTPFSMRCLSCGEYIAKSKKFNARKEGTDEKYLQQKIFRFHIRCPRCNSEIVFRTDPKTSDFVMELGGERNYNPVKDKAQTKLESYEEILERLEKEDAIEREELANKEKLNKMTKIQELEGKLLEQEQEELLNDELKKIMNRNKNQDTPITINQKKDEDDEAELDKLAREEFLKFKKAQSKAPLVAQSTSSSSVASETDAPISSIKQLPTPPSLNAKHEAVKMKVGLVSGYDSSSSEEDDVEDGDGEAVQPIKRVIKVGIKRHGNGFKGSNSKKSKN